MEIQKNIAAAIRRLMSEQDKTLTELATEFDVPLTSLKGYAKGTANPRADTIEMLAEKLGITPAELISSPPVGWKQAYTVLLASKEFGSLTPERREEGIQLLLQLAALFAEN